MKEHNFECDEPALCDLADEKTVPSVDDLMLCALRMTGDENRRAQIHLDVLRSIAERMLRLRSAARYGVAIHTPSALDGPMYHHVDLFMKQAGRAIDDVS